MNQPDEIKLGDFVAIDMNGHIVKATGPTDNKIGTALDNYGRVVTINLDQVVAIMGMKRLPELPICIICKRTDHELPPDYQYCGLKFDHPFLKDNLELLEWKYVESLKSKARD